MQFCCDFELALTVVREKVFNRILEKEGNISFEQNKLVHFLHRFPEFLFIFILQHFAGIGH